MGIIQLAERNYWHFLGGWNVYRLTMINTKPKEVSSVTRIQTRSRPFFFLFIYRQISGAKFCACAPILKRIFKDVGMDQYLLIPFLGGYSHPFTSYFDVNYRYYWFWHTAMLISARSQPQAPAFLQIVDCWALLPASREVNQRVIHQEAFWAAAFQSLGMFESYPLVMSK